ncbi:factor associated with metabolism and energy [Buteo buteo]|uniref:factor associated with metabolism and energy n=1 Tax=Buteo buteo TaxID=30397 RepID=UPI003EBF98B7
MGLSSSKTHPKVTKVAPMRDREDLPALTTPYQLPGVHPPATAEWGKSTFYGELPPLRETWYGRASAGPLSFNTVLEKGETSIIKQHPPRRPQRLEPAGPPQAIAPAKPWSQQDVVATPKMKALEKRGQSLRHLPGRRQHLHKLQMLDLTRRRREAELKRNLHREAKINKEKIKEFSPKKVLDTLQRGDSAESQDLVPAEHNQHFHGDDHGNTWGGGLSTQHDGAEVSPGRSGKVDLWFCREPRTRDLFWDTSSTGSDEWEREEKIYRKPKLVRTKTERVSLFDDFFDRDF